MNPAAFAKQIKDKHPHLKRCKVKVLDGDGCLVIEVRNGNGSILVARHDTGLSGNADPRETEIVAERLRKELTIIGINALPKRRDEKADPDLDLLIRILNEGVNHPAGILDNYTGAAAATLMIQALLDGRCKVTVPGALALLQMKMK